MSKDKPNPNSNSNSSSLPNLPFGDLSLWAEPPWYHSIPSPYYTPSHYLLRNFLRSYIDTHILPFALSWEKAGTAPISARLAFASSSIPFAEIPAEYRPKDNVGPAGIKVEELDAFHTLILNDELTRIPGASVVSLGGASVIGIPPILNYGSEEQKARWLPGLFSWSTSYSLGITEPDVGSDVANISTTARKSVNSKGKEVYIVNGHKKWITGTPWATHMTTAVRTGGPGREGISVLVIPMDTKGVTWMRIENSGQNAGGASFVELDEVEVPCENLLGVEGGGFDIIMRNFNKERYILAISQNRSARTCLSIALQYAHKRHTFNKPLIANQSITAKLATVARHVESHWAWLEQIAYAVQNSPDGWQDKDIAGRIALAKVHGGRIVELANREAQQVLGGAGYQRGEGVGGVVEQISRDLRMLVVGGGSEEILTDLAVRQEVLLAKKRNWKI